MPRSAPESVQGSTHMCSTMFLRVFNTSSSRIYAVNLIYPLDPFTAISVIGQSHSTAGDMRTINARRLYNAGTGLSNVLLDLILYIPTGYSIFWFTVLRALWLADVVIEWKCRHYGKFSRNLKELLLVVLIGIRTRKKVTYSVYRISRLSRCLIYDYIRGVAHLLAQ